MIFYGRVDKIIIKKSGTFFQKIVDALGQTLFVKRAEFDIPDNDIINFDLQWENDVILLVYLVLSNVIEFNNMMYLTEVAKNINFFINYFLNEQLDELITLGYLS